MTIGYLPYPSTTMHARVAGFDREDESPLGHCGEGLLSSVEWDALIHRAYNQLFFHTFSADREPFLESQLRNGQINVRQFMRGLCLSERFRCWVYRCNNNYEVVAHVVQRLLGRDLNGEKEKLAWSIVIAQQGLAGLVDAILDSQEYINTFGNNTVPHQRRRLLSGRMMGQVPLNVMLPRYGHHWRDAMAERAPTGASARQLRTSEAWASGVPKVAFKLGAVLSIIGTFEVARVVLTVIMAIASTAGH